MGFSFAMPAVLLPATVCPSTAWISPPYCLAPIFAPYQAFYFKILDFFDRFGKLCLSVTTGHARLTGRACPTDRDYIEYFHMPMTSLILGDEEQPCLVELITVRLVKLSLVQILAAYSRRLYIVFYGLGSVTVTKQSFKYWSLSHFSIYSHSSSRKNL